MAKNIKEARSGSDKKAVGGKGVSLSSKATKSSAASALTQRPVKASITSQRVIKEASSTHRDALKRLADR